MIEQLQGVNKALSGDLASVGQLLNCSSFQRLLIDDVPGSTQTVTANKLKRGLYLTSFNQLENCIIEATVAAFNCFNKRANTGIRVADSTFQKARTSLISALGNIPPRYPEHGHYSIVNELAEALTSLDGGLPYFLSEYAVYQRSNVSLSEMHDAAQLMRKIVNDRYVTDGGRTDRTCKSLRPFLNSYIASSDPDLLVVRGQLTLEYHYNQFLDERHRAAHDVSRAPEVPFISSLGIFSRAFLEAFSVYCYCLYLAVVHGASPWVLKVESRASGLIITGESFFSSKNSCVVTEFSTSWPTYCLSFV